PAWVKVIALGYVGNGLGYRQGVDERALPYYEKYIGQFTEAEISEFARLFQDPEFASVLGSSKTDARARQLASTLIDGTDRSAFKAALRLIIDAPAKTLTKLAGTTAYQRAIAGVRK